MINFRQKWFSTTSEIKEINVFDVVDYLKNYKDLSWKIGYRGVNYSSGIRLEGLINEGNVISFSECVKQLDSDFAYQFTTGFVDGIEMKFNIQEVITKLSDGEVHAVELNFSPTTKIELNKYTTYVPYRAIFYIADVSKIRQLLKEGIKPEGMNQRGFGLVYPPQSHFMISLNEGISLKGGNVVDKNSNEDTKMILVKVDPRKYEFFLDPNCICGCCSYQTIKPEDIEIVDRDDYAKIFSIYKDERYNPCNNFYKDIRLV